MIIESIISKQPKTDEIMVNEWSKLGLLSGTLENDKLDLAKLLDKIYHKLLEQPNLHDNIVNYETMIFPIMVRVFNGIIGINEDNHFRYHQKSEEEIKNTIQNLDYQFIMDELARVYNDVFQLMEKIKPIGADFEAETCAYCADHIIHMIFYLRKKAL